MKRIHRSSSPRAIRLVSLAVCYALIVTTVFLPLGPSVIGAGGKGNNPAAGSSSSRFVPRAAILAAPGRLLASLMTFLQGGGPPSVPGSNLPDLDAARAVQPSEPVAPAPTPSDQACTDCTPCPTCGPGSINHAPGAQAGGPYYGTVGTPLVVSGLGSFDVDPGDDIGAYAWTFGDPTGVFTGATPVHTYAAPGNYTISLTVTDSHNATAMASTTASITAAPPSVPSSGTTQGNAAQFIAQSVPTTMTAGQSYPVSVTMRNTGTTTWSAAHLYRLGSQGPQDNGNWGMARVYLPAAVAPTAEVTFRFTVRAPFGNPLTTVNFQWRMVEDGVEWFGDTHNDVVLVATGPGVWEIEQTGPGDLYNSRLEPSNRTGAPGEDLLSGNFNWGLDVLNLAGRAGLNLSLPLSYNSLVWTRFIQKEATVFMFDADRGFPSPGFRLGFPAIQGPFLNEQTQGNSYLMIMPSGSRVELRQVGSTSLYESVDASHLQLSEGGNGSLLVRTTSGTQLAYWSINSEYRCTEIKDRNGNYITVKYDPINGVANLGRITSVIDTVGRTINFNYDSNFRLQTITQLRNGQSHVWASFGYSDLEVETNFSAGQTDPNGKATKEAPAGPTVLGLPEGNTVSVLTQVGLDDGSRYNFDYTSWGQIYRMHHYAADGHQLNYTSYNLPLDPSDQQTDCPRFTQRLDWAENWNNNNAVTTNFQIDPSGTSGEVTTAAGTPDQVTYKEFFSTDYSDWSRGLVTRTEIYSANSSLPKKTTITDWTQDNMNVPYPLNPRPTAMTISDAEGNRRRTTIEYASFGLPADVYELGPYGADDWRILRRTHTDYNLSEAYVNRRIIGLVEGQYLFAPDAPNSPSAQTLLSKTTMEYDAGGEFLQAQGSAVVQHDDINYLWNFVQGRGNVTKALRWDINHETNPAHATASTIGYNTTGLAIFTRDPVAGHQTTIRYDDVFSNDGTNPTTAPVTLAYPTSVTVNDPAPISSKVSYNYDLGVVTRSEGPPPAGHQQGAIQITEYDSAGRVKRVTNAVNGAYTRLVYPTSQTIVNKFTTIQEGQGEAYSATILDGAGRVRAVAGDFPDTTWHYSGQFTHYDQMGRADQSYNPTEMTSGWAATGADGGGWNSSSQTYDWKGRPLVTTNQDGTTKEASYGGCGCAGGAVVTLTDEGTMDAGVPKRRQQKISSDPLGRTIKTELLNWQGGSVYATTVKTYNARDQLTLVRQYQGAESSGAYQDTTMTYDGFGRPKTKHVPEQDANTATTFNYNADDSALSVVDARGASQTLTYNNRGLVTGITYAAPAGIPTTPNVSFEYDAAGNRTSMSDGMGGVSYEYNQLSQLTSEARTFSDAGNSAINGVTKTVSYDYNLAGELKSVTDPAGATINYDFDATGRLSAVTGSVFAGVTTYASGAQYRAWGALKHLNYGNSKTLDATYNTRLQAASFNIPGVMSKTYDYYADGQLRFSSDLLDHKFDRSYSHDHLGRLKQAFSGAEARGEPVTNDRPYRETFAYDGFSHLTNRATNNWNDFYSMPEDSYTNDRRDGWDYDAEGNLFASVDVTYSYDAAGEIRTVGTYEPQSTTTRGLDGDGQQLKTVESTFKESSQTWETTTTYYLHSTVLGGQVLTELAADGAKTRTFVYAGGTVLAWQKFFGPYQAVEWEHRDASNASFRTTMINGDSWDAAELDPIGADAGTHAPLISPNPPDENGGSLTPYPSFMDSQSGLTRTYRQDGIAVSVDYFMRALEFRFHGSSLEMAEFFSRASTRVVGYRSTGVRFGRTFDATYDTHWHMTSLSEGTTTDSSLAGYSIDSPIYDTSYSWSFAFAVLPQNPATGPAPGFDKALGPPPSMKLTGCIVDISITNNNLLDGKQLQAMKNEISRIFATGGQEINFVSSNASYYLNVNAHGANYTNNPAAVGLTPLNGSAVTNNGRVFVDRLTASATSDSGATAFNQNSNALAIGLGRAGSHEISHYLLQQNYDSSQISGVMHAGFTGSQWFSTSAEGMWKFTPAQIKQLNSLCGR